jgi:glucokinase
VRAGLDLGGTKIQAAVLDERGEVVGKSRHPTPGKGGPPAVVDALANALREAAEDASVEPGKLEGVGVGSPGAVDAGAGTVADARNIPEWSDAPYPVGPELSERVGVPVALGNDVQVAVEAEYELGAGKGSRSLLGVFWGTGVGGGIILDGEPWLGRGAAGEIGHMVVKKGGAQCPCGRLGCMEAYAGRGAMEARARGLADKGRETVLFEIMEERGRSRLQSGIWERALKAGDELAIELVDRALEALGAGIASAVNLLDVETVVIGGGLGTRLGEPYVERIEEQMKPHLFVDERPPAVRLAALGDLGGATGAALLIASRPVS